MSILIFFLIIHKGRTLFSLKRSFNIYFKHIKMICAGDIFHAMLAPILRRLRWRRMSLWLLAMAIVGCLGFLIFTNQVPVLDEDPLSLKTKLKEAAKAFSWGSDDDHQPPSLQPPPQSPQPRQPTSLQAFQNRSQRVRDACSAKSGSAAQGQPPFPYHSLYVRSMSFCALPKTGTTFWKWILYYVDKNMTGPLLSHDYGDIHKLTRYMEKADRLPPSDGFKNIVFVREPYARLFSAYVDKLFTPRWENWQRLAQPAMAYARPGASFINRRCSHNVTFSEFVRFFIHGEMDRDARVKRNEHFVPISHQCNFCGIGYDFIGRQERFAEDTLGILRQLNRSDILTFSALDEHYEVYFMDALIKYHFEHELKKISATFRCMSAEQILRRMWKAVQIRGTLSAEEFFPLARSDIQGMTLEGFLLMAHLAYNRSASDKDRQHNTAQALFEAYSTVPLHDRQLLRQIFDDDFKLFGYEPNHPLVFPPEDEFDLPYYRYFDIYDSFLYTSIV
ncbi:carbohydrate sulfotransferase 13-like [Littorina saxatilis]